MHGSHRSGLKVFRSTVLVAAVAASASLAVGATSCFALASPSYLPPRASGAGVSVGAAAVASSGSSASRGSRRTWATAVAAGAGAAAAAAALIVQGRGAGREEIGRHLARKLRQRGLGVVLLGDVADRSGPAFSAHSLLEAEGVVVARADLARQDAFTAAAEETRAAVGGRFDFVFDIGTACPGAVQDACRGWRPRLYAYVGNASVYRARGDAPLLEDGPVDEASPELAVERRAAASGELPWCAFRLQHVYGPPASDGGCLDYFLDRLTRGLPVPLPGDGHQRTTLTHVEDVAGMLARAVEVPAEVVGEAFNCASDRRVSYLKILADVGACLGMDREAAKARAVFYRPGAVDVPEDAPRFPFGDVHFGVGVAKAKRQLLWKPSRRLDEEYLTAHLAEYRRSGRDQRPIDLRFDEAVFASLGRQLESAVSVGQAVAVDA